MFSVKFYLTREEFMFNFENMGKGFNLSSKKFHNFRLNFFVLKSAPDWWFTPLGMGSCDRSAIGTIFLLRTFFSFDYFLDHLQLLSQLLFLHLNKIIRLQEFSSVPGATLEIPEVYFCRIFFFCLRDTSDISYWERCFQRFIFFGGEVKSPLKTDSRVKQSGWMICLRFG